MSPTPFDVNLVAFRIPIRVHPSFWIGAIMLGWRPDHLEVTFICVLCVFVSILVHELGHAFTAEFYGWPSHIVLYLMGGVTLSDRFRNNTPARNIVLSFMGPAAGFMLFALVIGVELVLDRFQIWDNRYRHIIFYYLEFINLWWGLFNLLPVLPLDGGHICQSLCQMMRFRDPDGVTFKVGIAVAGAAAFYFFNYVRESFAGILMVLLCIQNLTALQSRR